MMKKRIGIILPPKHESMNIVEGSGLLPDDVREALITSLAKHPNIADVVLCDIANMYVKNGKVYHWDVCLSELDLVHWYFATHLPASWEVLMLQTIARATRVVPDPFAMADALDKFVSHTILRNADIATANFSLFRASNVHDHANRLSWKKPVLLKPRLGAFGHGIHMAKTKREFIDIVEYAQSFTKEDMQIFCEEFEENDITQWISTTVIDGNLVYGYRKHADKFVDDWKVYDADRKGGGVDFVDPARVKDIALAAAKALKCDIIGFDFIYSHKRQQHVIVDENTFPGMYPHCFAHSGTGNWEDHFLAMILNNVGLGISSVSKPQKRAGELL